jgi:hypothetical protein
MYYLPTRVTQNSADERPNASTNEINTCVPLTVELSIILDYITATQL